MNSLLHRFRTWLAGPPREERRLDRHPRTARWLFLLVLVLGLTYCVLHLVRFASIVTDENVYVTGARGVTITSVVQGGASDRAGLLVGDVIIEVNGNPVKTSEDAMVYIVEGGKGKVLDYTVLRGDRTLLLHVMLAEYGVPLGMLLQMIVGVICLAVGAFVFLRRPDNKTARLFGWAQLAGALFLSLMYGYSMWYYPDWLTGIRGPIVMLTWSLSFSTFYHLTLRIPEPRFTTPVTRGMLLLVYLLPIAAPVIMGLVAPKNALALNVGITLMLIAAMEVSMHLGFRAQRNPDYASRSRMIKWAGISTLVFFILLALGSSIETLQALYIIVAAVPLLFFATVVRYRLFDLYVVFRKSSLYSVLVVVLDFLTLVAAFVAVNILANAAWNIPILDLSTRSVEIVRLDALPYERQLVVEKGMLIMLGIAATGLIVLSRRALRRRIDRVFHRTSYDYRRALQDFSHLSTRYSDRQSLADEVVRDVTAIMHLTGAALAWRHNGRFDISATHGLVVGEALAGSLASDAAWLAELTDKGGAEAAANLGLDERVRADGVEFIVPVFVDRRIEALLALGGKKAETNYTRDDVELLNNLAINIADAMVVMDFYEGAKEQERMRRELEIARRIQLGALPVDVPVFPGIDVSAASIPAQEVGGDFYDFLAHHDAITFLVGDVSGKGTPAALYLSRIQGVVRAIDSYQPSLWELFVRLNTQIFDYTERQVFVTLAGLRVELSEHRCTFLRAGHLPLVHYVAAEERIAYYRPDGIGAGLDLTRFGESLEECTITPGVGDVCALLTDGIVEAFDASGREFTIESVGDIVRAHAQGSADSIRHAIVDAVTTHVGGEQPHDDMTLVIVRFS